MKLIIINKYFLPRLLDELVLSSVSVHKMYFVGRKWLTSCYTFITVEVDDLVGGLVPVKDNTGESTRNRMFFKIKCDILYSLFRGRRLIYCPHTSRSYTHIFVLNNVCCVDYATFQYIMGRLRVKIYK